MSADISIPVDHPVVSVGTSPTALVSDPDVISRGWRKGLFLQPTSDIFLGGPAVTTLTGIQVFGGERFFLDTLQGQGWYAIAASGTVNTRVLPVF